MKKSLASFLLLGGAWAFGPARADEPELPDHGFEASHYESLWTKSPFAVATADAAAPESEDYDLAGVAQVDGVSYASLIDKHNNGVHFVVTGDKPDHGISLVSITQARNGSGAEAVVQKDGALLTLKLPETPASTGTPTTVVPPLTLNFPMPGASPFPAGGPTARFHHRMIVIPPR